MRVTVVLMRSEGGRKLSEAELKAATRHAGYIEIGPRAATLYTRPEGPVTVVPFLFEPEIRHMRGDEFVVTGRVTVPGGNVGDRWRQAWWCTLRSD